MRVLFCVLPEKGHLHPYIGPAQVLSARGATVAFWAPGDLGPSLTRAGLAQIGEYPLAGEATRGAVFAERVGDAAWLRIFIKTMLVDSVAAQLPFIHRAVADFAPDVIAIDPMCYAAAIAAERACIPWAAISNSLNPILPAGLDSELLATVRWLDAARAAVFAAYGLAPQFSGCDLLSPRLTIAFATQAFAGGATAGVELVGPSLPRGLRGDEAPFDWSWRDQRPLVYVSFGSQIYHQPARFRRIADAIAGLPLQALLSVGDLSLPSLPPNVRAVAYAPQLDALRRAAAFITHGGANSVMEALAAGVPMLVAPICNDQFHQAHFVAQAGVGRAIELDTCDIAAELAALEAMRARVNDIAAGYQVDGAARTAELVSALVAKSRPAPRS